MNRYFILNKLQLALHTHLQQLLLVILQNLLCCSTHKTKILNLCSNAGGLNYNADSQSWQTNN